MLQILSEGTSLILRTQERQVAGSIELPGCGVWLSPDTVAWIAKLCAIPPGLSADAAEVAQIEARLEEALAERIIVKLCRNHTRGYGFCYEITPHEGETWYSSWDARLPAAQAALAYVETLETEAAKAKLPDVGSMAYPQMHTELYGLGWRQVMGIEGYAHHEHDDIWAHRGEDRDVFMRRALTHARKLDAPS